MDQWLRKILIERLHFFRRNEHWKHEDVHESIKYMLCRAQLLNCPVATVFNDTYFVVTPDMTLEQANNAWDTAIRNDYDRYEKSYRAGVARRKQQAYQKDQNERRQRILAMLREESLQVPWWRKLEYARAVKSCRNNPYTQATIAYARAWGVLMQQAMRSGSTLEDVAQKLSHDADYDGISGNMYGMAVAFLALYWKDGDRLRRWSNLQLQIGNEGEAANKTGGVLNSALLRIGTNE